MLPEPSTVRLTLLEAVVLALMLMLPLLPVSVMRTIAGTESGLARVMEP